MMERDNSGRFVKGHAGGSGRPKGSGKMYAKDIVWESLNHLVWLIFKCSDQEFTNWIKENQHTLSRAEKVFLDRLNDKVDAPYALESLMDRVVGRTLKIDGEVIHRNPLIESLYSKKPDEIKQELEQLKQNKEIIDAEYKSIQASNGTGAPGNAETQRLGSNVVSSSGSGEREGD